MKTIIKKILLSKKFIVIALMLLFVCVFNNDYNNIKANSVVTVEPGIVQAQGDMFPKHFLTGNKRPNDSSLAIKIPHEQMLKWFSNATVTVYNDTVNHEIEYYYRLNQKDLYYSVSKPVFQMPDNYKVTDIRAHTNSVTGYVTGYIAPKVQNFKKTVVWRATLSGCAFSILIAVSIYLTSSTRARNKNVKLVKYA